MRLTLAGIIGAVRDGERPDYDTDRELLSKIHETEHALLDRMSDERREGPDGKQAQDALDALEQVLGALEGFDSAGVPELLRTAAQ